MTQNQHPLAAMSRDEKRGITGLSLIFAMRMFGLFLILPVFSLAATEYASSTPVLIGLALGAYGLTQALLQIPFGMLSDRIGRKKVIFMGLVLFALGSLIAALAESIYTVILGRLLQGSGAIAAAVLALTADLTRDQHRTKAMAGIGISIGLSFTLSLAFGAALEQWVGLPGIFWVSAGLAVLGMVILFVIVPNPTRLVVHQDIEPVAMQFQRVLGNLAIMQMVLSISILHALLTLVFFALPMTLLEGANWPQSAHAMTYLPIMLLAFISMVPFIVIAEKQRQIKPVFLGAIATLALALLIWSAMPPRLWLILIALWLFFTAFNVLEASLPSLMSKLCPLEYKGTAMGVYSTGQFLGAFAGGIAAGFVYVHWGMSAVFTVGFVLTLLWFGLMWPFRAPAHLNHVLVQLPSVNAANAEDAAAQLRAFKGVREVVVVVDEAVAYVKYHPDETDIQALQTFELRA